MKHVSLKALAALLRHSESTTALRPLQKLFSFVIPFNAPHGFKIRKISREETVTCVPFKRANKNHIGTVHACAIATLGEFSAGLLLIKNFEPSKYRLVLTRLECEYLRHATGQLLGVCKGASKPQSLVGKTLGKEGSASAPLETQIFDKQGRKVAVVRTVWQLKAWALVKR